MMTISRSEFARNHLALCLQVLGAMRIASKRARHSKGLQTDIAQALRAQVYETCKHCRRRKRDGIASSI